MLQHHFNWKTLSLIAGLTMWKFYFELFEDSIKGEHVIVFLRHLLRCIEGKLILVWDGLPAHRSKLVKEYLETVGDRVLVERLPAYAPELNPVEYIWAYLKHHQLPNVCPRDLWQVGEGAIRCLRRMRRRPRLVTAFWKQASLWE